MKLLRLAALLILPLLGACASIFNPSPEVVTFSTEPQGALVTYNGAQVGRTPCSVTMSARRGSIVSITLEGHHEQLVDANTEINRWIYANFLFGGILGLLIDAGTGSFTMVDDSPVLLRMTPLSQPEPYIWTREQVGMKGID